MEWARGPLPDHGALPDVQQGPDRCFRSKTRGEARCSLESLNINAARALRLEIPATRAVLFSRSTFTPGSIVGMRHAVIDSEPQHQGQI